MESEPLEEQYLSIPPPPEDLWDTKDVHCLEMVKCDAYVRISAIDPKAGHFRVRMKCIWAFRTLNQKEDAEIHLRGVPGIRMPGLVEVIEESRIWKDLAFSGSSQTTCKTVFWRGISLFTMDGFKCFEMHQFPFDRHILNLERLEFVWRPEKDAADYYKSMKVCSFKVMASSMLPEWNVHHENAVISALNPTTPDSGQTDRQPTSASKFTVRLRIERKHEFYSRQVFFVTYLITLLTCCPLGMKPSEVGDRLSVFVGGTLTLVAFKYGVSDHLPSVPYQTFTDHFLMSQILTVFWCGILSILSYRIGQEDMWPEVEGVIDWVENVLGVLLLTGWTLAFLFTILIKPRQGWRSSWPDIIAAEQERQDAFGREEEEREKRIDIAQSELNRAESGDFSSDLRQQLNLTDEQAKKLADLQKRGLFASPDKDMSKNS